MYQGNGRLSVYMTKLQDMQQVPKRFETGRQYKWKSYNTHSMYLQDLKMHGRQYTWLSYNTKHVPTRPETGRQYTWQSYNTQHVPMLCKV